MHALHGDHSDSVEFLFIQEDAVFPFDLILLHHL